MNDLIGIDGFHPVRYIDPSAINATLESLFAPLYGGLEESLFTVWMPDYKPDLTNFGDVK